jgi:phosphoadenosine phosphosulfate reductase
VATEPAERRKFAALAESAGIALEGAEAEAILRWAIDQFGAGLCVAASMADAVLIQMISSIRPSVDVIFLDTGYHFPETLRTRDEVAARYPVRMLSIMPRQTVAEQDGLFGPELFGRDPDACCSLRKVEPLRRALEPYQAWVSGIRREETESRRAARVVEWDANRSIVKLNPLASWTTAQVDDYIAEHDIVVNPLLAAGYPSVGCVPCTRRVGAGEDPRSGRWAGSGKSECGLHVDATGKPVRATSEPIAE